MQAPVANAIDSANFSTAEIGNGSVVHDGFHHCQVGPNHARLPKPSALRTAVPLDAAAAARAAAQTLRIGAVRRVDAGAGDLNGRCIVALNSGRLAAPQRSCSWTDPPQLG